MMLTIWIAFLAGALQPSSLVTAVRLTSEDPPPRVTPSLREADASVVETQSDFNSASAPQRLDVAAESSEESRPQKLRVGADLEQRGEKLQQRFYRKELVKQLQCIDCVTRGAKRDYTITEGSLLGAARGGFFLPWDSDGDISFDARGADGSEDPEGFYKLFSQEAARQRNEKCPTCGDVVLAHFVSDLPHGPNETSPPLWHWQPYDAIKSGVLLEASNQTYRKVPEALHTQLLERLKGRIDSRLFWNKPYVCGGGPYIDVEPFYIEDERWQNLAINTSSSDALPFQRCSVAHFDEASVTQVDLSCPKKPAAFLQKYYGADWKQVPYNKFDGSKWAMDKGGPALAEFLQGASKGSSGSLKPVTESS